MYEELLNDTIQRVKPSGIRKFFDLANTKENVISLGVGEPDFATPWNICEAAIYSIKSKKTHYTANAGLLPLREEICRYLNRRFHLTYDPLKNIIVTVGGSEAIDIALRSIVNPGDEVILLQPCYVAYEPAVVLAGGVVKFIELKSENEFKLTAQELEAAITPKTKAILLNFPSNPTGGVMTKEDYEPLIPIIKKHKLVVISDEIYAELSYGEKHCSPANFDEIKDLVIIISGFSKAFAMTGWRLGYLVANETFVKQMLKIHQYIIMSAPTAAQFGAIEGLRNGLKYVDEMVEQYQMRRNFIVHGFNKIGLPTHMPQGAFYIFPCIKKTGLTSLEFCEQLLEEQNVACVPGTAFGEAGEGYIRVSYAYSIEEIKAAIEKLGSLWRNTMKIISNAIQQGYFLDDHGKHGKEISIPFEILDYPKETKSFAFLLEDKDAIPVCGFSFIHWVGYNLTISKVESGASENHPPFNQEVHSCSHEMKEHYVGMAPPDQDHRYELHVYALDSMLDLSDGVPFNQVYWAMEGHVLEQATLSAYYRS